MKTSYEPLPTDIKSAHDALNMIIKEGTVHHSDLIKYVNVGVAIGPGVTPRSERGIAFSQGFFDLDFTGLTLGQILSYEFGLSLSMARSLTEALYIFCERDQHRRDQDIDIFEPDAALEQVATFLIRLHAEGLDMQRESRA